MAEINGEPVCNDCFQIYEVTMPAGLGSDESTCIPEISRIRPCDGTGCSCSYSEENIEL